MIREVTNYNMIAKHLSDVILSSLVRKRNGWFTYHYIFSLSCKGRRKVSLRSNSPISSLVAKDKSIKLAFFSQRSKRSRKEFERPATSSITRPKVRPKNPTNALDRTVLSLKNMCRLDQERSRWLCYEVLLHFNPARLWRRIRQVKPSPKFLRKTRRKNNCKEPRRTGWLSEKQTEGKKRTDKKAQKISDKLTQPWKMIWMEVTVWSGYHKATCLTRAKSSSTHGSSITVMLSSKNK